MGFVAWLAVGVAAAAVLWLVVTCALVHAAAWRSMSAAHRIAGWLLVVGVATLMTDSVLPAAHVTPIHNGAPFDVELGDWAFLLALGPTLLVLLWATTRPHGWQGAIGIVLAVALVPGVVITTLASISADLRTVAPQATGVVPLPEVGLVVAMLACGAILVASILWVVAPLPAGPE